MEYKIVKEDVKNYWETEYALHKPGIDDVSKMSPPQAKNFQIYGDKTFLRPKIYGSPPRQNRKFPIPPQNLFLPRHLKKWVPPPRQNP